MIAPGGDGRTTWRTGSSPCGWMDREGTHENRGGTHEKPFEYRKSIYQSISGVPPTLTLARKELDHLQGSFPI